LQFKQSFNIKNYFSFELGQNKIGIKNLCEKKYGKDLAKKIIQKTGPEHIYYCNQDENTLSLSLNAWEKIKKKIDKKSIKNLVYVTETNFYEYPGNGYLFASKADLSENIKIYDLNSGCTGFVEALILAESLLGDTLIVCSETYSKNIKNFDRSISTLFSDCSTIFYFKKDTFKVRENFSFFKKYTYDDLRKKKNESLVMNGINVFSFVSTTVSPKIIDFLKITKKKYEISSLYLHQASKIVVDYFGNKKEFRDFNVPNNVCIVGNTVSSSIPMLLIYDNVKLNKLKSKNIFLCGFGVGLSCSGLILEINK
jgi:3-oxoacyl-[acyl-carrier-protein] synthase-3